MAKGKRAAALFEVINKETRYQPHVRTERAPMRWLKNRVAAKSPVVRSTVAVDVSNDPTMRPHALLRSHQSLGVVEMEPADRPLREPLGGRTPVAGSISIVPAVTVDRGKQLIRFRVSYTSAIITGFALLVAVGIAYLIGRGLGTPTGAPVTGTTTEQLQKGPTNPAVMEVGRGAPQPTIAEQLTLAERNPAATPVPPPPTPNVRGDRIVGINYVIIQSYPEQDEAAAAVELLRQHNIAATIEKGTPYAPRWFSVVGLQPFDQMTGNPQYTNYMKQIEAISSKFAGNSKFKRFEPKPFKWQKK